MDSDPDNMYDPATVSTSRQRAIVAGSDGAGFMVHVYREGRVYSRHRVSVVECGSSYGVIVEESDNKLSILGVVVRTNGGWIFTLCKALSSHEQWQLVRQYETAVDWLADPRVRAMFAALMEVT